VRQWGTKNFVADSGISGLELVFKIQFFLSLGSSVCFLSGELMRLDKE
jgi:hypothetical protein